jgi:N utilization substance protein A
MSVYSDDPNIDAQGACIGPKGSRVNAIVNELAGEKVDVIPYSTNPSEYIVKALSPAKVIMVQLNETTGQAKVVVPDDKLSLAIGKGGQNAKLAAKLTGYKIDVKPYSVAIQDDADFAVLGDEE